MKKEKCLYVFWDKDKKAKSLYYVGEKKQEAQNIFQKKYVSVIDLFWLIPKNARGEKFPGVIYEKDSQRYISKLSQGKIVVEEKYVEKKYADQKDYYTLDSKDIEGRYYKEGRLYKFNNNYKKCEYSKTLNLVYIENTPYGNFPTVFAKLNNGNTRVYYFSKYTPKKFFYINFDAKMVKQ